MKQIFDRLHHLLSRKPMLRYMKILAVAFFVVIVYRVILEAVKKRQQNYASVIEQLVVNELHERGILEAAQTWPVELGAGGEIREMAEDGSFVQAGQIVARVDDTDYADQLQRREEERVTLDMALEIVKMRRDQTYADAIASLLLASNRLNLARMELAKIQNGLLPVDKRKLEITAKLRAIEYDELMEQLAREKKLVQDGLASALSVEDTERRVAAAELAAQEAELELAIRAGPPREEDLLEASRTVDRLLGECGRSERIMGRRMARADAKIAEAEARVSLNNFELERDSSLLSQCAVNAQTAGVFRVRWFKEWRLGSAAQPIKPGVSRRGSDRIADIVQPGAMRIMAMIHEADIAGVATGMSARVVIPALGDRSFPATVIALGGVGRDRYDVAPAGIEPSLSGVAVFNAVLSLNGDDERLRPGMSAVVSISLAEPVKKLVVPREAVQLRENGVGEVIVAGHKKRQITGRIINEYYFEIFDGLKKGDRVFTRFPKEGGA